MIFSRLGVGPLSPPRIALFHGTAKCSLTGVRGGENKKNFKKPVDGGAHLARLSLVHRTGLICPRGTPFAQRLEIVNGSRHPEVSALCRAL
jgi:hypothetical protein